MLNNQKGSVMTVAVVLIALLSFSLTSITAYTFRTAENTNRSVEENSADNNAKRLVTEASVRLRRGVEDYILENGIEAFDSFDVNSDDTEVIIPPIEADLGVTIRHAPEKYDETLIDDPLPDEEVHIRAYRIAYPVSEDRSVVRYIHLTTHTIAYEEFEALKYSVGSGENLMLNGGEFLNSADLYGKHFYTGHETAYKDANDEYVIIGPTTGYDTATYNYPSAPADEESTFISPNYRWCDDTGGCLAKTDDGSGALKVRHDNYEPAQVTGDRYFYDFLQDFDFDDHFYDALPLSLDDPEDAVNPDSDVTAYLDGHIADGTLVPMDATQTGGFTLNNHRIIEGDATFTLDENDVALNGNTIVIKGDLTLDTVADMKDNKLHTLLGPGRIFVFGDVLFKNDSDLELNVPFFSLGRITADFGNDSGFSVPEGVNKQSFGFFAKDHILFENNSTTETNNGIRPALFLFTESSIKFNSASQPMHFAGAMYAQGLGTGLEDVVVESNGIQVPFRGILVNSFYGTVTVSSDGNDTVSPGNVYSTNPSGKPKKNNGNGQGAGTTPASGELPGTSAPGEEGGEHSFSFTKLDSATSNGHQETLEETFSYVPNLPTLEIKSASEEESYLQAEYSTFIYEDTEN